MNYGKYISYIPKVDAVSYVVSVEVMDANMLMRTYCLRISVPLGSHRNLVYITIGGAHTYEFDIPGDEKIDAAWAQAVGERFVKKEEERKNNDANK